MRVLVVDDSTLFRKVVRDALASEPGVEVVGTAANGRLALEKIRQLRPDVVTLDLEMPELDGLEVLRQLQGQPDAPSVLMLSALTGSGAAQTTRALRLGAFDFILKPQEQSFDANLERLRVELGPKLRLVEAARAKSSAAAAADVLSNPSEQMGATETPPRQATITPPAARPLIVAIGISTGGPAALSQLLPRLPADFPLPIAIVQHMPPLFTRSLAEDLDKNSRLRVGEAVDGQPLRPGTVSIAPGGRQMKIVPTAEGPTIAITDDPPEKSCRPSVDYLFRSIAHLYGPKCLAVIMTGMGDDGLIGCKLLKRHGATILAQDEASCVVFGMPRQVVEAGLADAVAPLDELPEMILHTVERGAVACN